MGLKLEINHYSFAYPFDSASMVPKDCDSFFAWYRTTIFCISTASILDARKMPALKKCVDFLKCIETYSLCGLLHMCMYRRKNKIEVKGDFKFLYISVWCSSPTW